MTKQLILSPEDIHLIDKFKIRFVNNPGYYRIYFYDGSYQYLHRYLLNAGENDIVDHIDRNRHNNSRDNLRFVSAKLNAYNKDVNNKFGRGIYFDKWGNRFRACISHKNKTIKLGSFKTIDEAKMAYNKKSLELYGKDAFLH